MSRKVIHKRNCRCQENPDEWSVIAPKFHNCFFTYMRYNNRPHTLQEIGKLLGMTITAVTVTEKKAVAKMLKFLNSEKGKKLKLGMLD